MRLITQLRLCDPAMSITEAQAFLNVCQHDGEYTVRDLANIMGLTQSGMSRMLQILGAGSPRYEKKRAGLGLVELLTDRNDMRLKRVRLTAKGRQVANSIRDLMKGDE
jgi:DNA-binding MarR family transcriptional regulator